MSYVHMIKLVVGAKDTETYMRYMRSTLTRLHDTDVMICTTRMMPKRVDELVNGGSLYRVINSRIVCRHPILFIDQVSDPLAPGGSYCRIAVAPECVETRPVAHRPFQGWRYLDPAKAPPDKTAADAKDTSRDELPPHMIRELESLGLL